MPLQVEIVAADRSVWEGQADSVTARTPEGEIGILPRHEPVIAALVPGVVSVSEGGSRSYFEVENGFLTVQADHVSIVSEVIRPTDGPRTADAH